MENKKHTIEYAQELSDSEVSVLESEGFVQGYMKAIEETAAPDLLEALQKIYKAQFTPNTTLAGLNIAIANSLKAIEKATK